MKITSVGERISVPVSARALAAIVDRLLKGPEHQRVEDFIVALDGASPGDHILIERQGVAGKVVKDLSKRLGLPASRMFEILDLPKATAERKTSTGELIGGKSGQAAIAVMRLLSLTEEMARNSTSSEAAGFDAALWLGEWLEEPNPSLGGSKPADLLDTPTGVQLVTRALLAIESGAYQ